MYYEEEIIDGILCHRGTPNGEWIPFTAEALTEQLRIANETIKLLIIQKNALRELI